MSADAQALSDEIDLLLARYLQLLDEYTSLYASFSTLQSSIYTDIARANFQAERGVRYGRESYDRRRIRAGWVCRVSGDVEEGTAVFEIEKTVVPETVRKDVPASKAQGEKGSVRSKTENMEEAMENITVQENNVSEAQDVEEDEQTKESPPKSTPESSDIPSAAPAQVPDPVRMFGFSIPSALRAAQSSSTQVVETSIPRLATVTLQMRTLEIQIRRARKYRTKALAVEGSKGGLKESGRKSVAV